ncbi:MAG: NAD(P)/FAD-dependent oxidoreductase [Bacillota bacterium]
MTSGELKNDIMEQGAIVQRDRETYAIAPHLPGGITDTATLRKLADIGDKYGCKLVKVTSAQRIALVGLKEEDLEQVWSGLGMDKGAAIGLCVRSIKICPGLDFCKRAKQDSVGLGLELDRKYHGMELPNKFKIGVSGCPNSCAESAVKDLGITGTANGYKIMVGGCAGGQARIAETIYEGKTREEVLEIAEQIITLYQNAARKGQRMGKFIDKTGLDNFVRYIDAPAAEKGKILEEIKRANSLN